MSWDGAKKVRSCGKKKVEKGKKVTDCNFSSLGLLGAVRVMDALNQFVYGYSVDDVDSLAVVSAADFNVHLLLLHIENDAVVPCART